MSDVNDPPRLCDDPRAPAALRTTLARARGAGPSPDQAAAVLAGVRARTGGGSPRVGDAGAPAPSVPPATQYYWSLAARFGWVLPVLLCAALPALVRGSAPRARPDARAALAARDAEVAATEAAPPARDATTPAPAPAGPAVAARPPAREPERAAAPGLVRARAAPCREVAHQQGVDAASQALRAREFGAALRLANEDRARCPRGPLAEDRERIAIEALARLGRTAEARARWDAFRRAFPRSLHARALHVVLHGAQPP